MIGHFAWLFPDETVQSGMAKSAARTEDPSKKSAVKTLFDRTTITAVTDLPAHLNTLVQSMPVVNDNDSAYLIDDHTLWPIFTVFQPSDRRTRSRLDMMGDGQPYLNLGLMATGCPFPRWLRFCPICSARDRVRFGETYWHRVHQVPGITVCAHHSVRLVNSNVSYRHSRNRHDFRPADEVIATEMPASEFIAGIEFELAKDVYWILLNPKFAIPVSDLRLHFVRALRERGWATYSGRIRMRAVKSAFRTTYSQDVLARLACLLPDSGETWLERMLRPNDGCQHPVRYLLIARFVGLRIQDIANAESVDRPFGLNPWPCLNKASDHFGSSTIPSCEITVTRNGHSLLGSFHCSLCGMVDTKRIANFVRIFDRTIAPEWIQALGWISPKASHKAFWLYEALLRGGGHVLKHLLIMRCLGVTIKEVVRALGSELIFEPGPWPCLNPECKNCGKAVVTAYNLAASAEGLPNGIFACECGFAYRRRGPDRDGKRRFAASQIVATGEAWDSQLARMWSDPAITIYAMSRRLLVQGGRVFTEARRLGLPEEKFRRTPYRAKSKHSATNGYRDKNRAAFIGCLKAHPDATRTDLYRICSGPVGWLKKWDTAWFIEHFPKSKKVAVAPKEPYIDWKMRDLRLAAEIRAARVHLIELPGRPIRITATRLLAITTASTYSWKKKNLDKVRAALEATVESDQSFALRQIQWFALHEAKFTARAILKRARVRKEWFRDSTFCAAARKILVRAGREIDLPLDNVASRADVTFGQTASSNVEEAA